MIRPYKSPVIMAVSGILLIGLHFAMICVVRDLAAVRASLRDYFMVPSDRADEAITMLNDHRAFIIFSGTTVLILALIPILVRVSKPRPWIGFWAALALYIPGVLYGNEIFYLSGKLIDWSRVLRDSERITTAHPELWGGFDEASSLSIFDESGDSAEQVKEVEVKISATFIEVGGGTEELDFDWLASFVHPVVESLGGEEPVTASQLGSGRNKNVNSQSVNFHQ